MHYTPGFLEVGNRAECTKARYLLLRDRKSEARIITGKMYPKANDFDLDAQLSAMMLGLKESVRAAESSSWHGNLGRLMRDGPSRRALSMYDLSLSNES